MVTVRITVGRLLWVIGSNLAKEHCEKRHDEYSTFCTQVRMQDLCILQRVPQGKSQKSQVQLSAHHGRGSAYADRRRCAEKNRGILSVSYTHLSLCKNQTHVSDQ